FRCSLDSSFHMRSTDLIAREPLDYGGFGEVYLCYHVTLGQVVLKTMYTGPLRNEKRSLLEEGIIMASLDHERVVKLLGVIMEDRDCSLVMELLPRGNLLVMLEEVSVPMSLKARIILEILEGMVYLTERNILHKDIKPENILVDKDFHIKIADLGLATCQTWSRLTKEESRRRSQMGRSRGARGAGTLSYMAPEHLESIHTVSTEKSDVYSFAIVLWVVLTGEEPYANARSEDHISQCVRNGNRPDEDLIPHDTPLEIIDLMKRCWDPDPHQRPTFREFIALYCNLLFLFNLVQKKYEGPEELVEKMRSLSISHGCSLTDSPAPLLSSDSSVSGPVEASIEDLHHIQNDSTEDQIETDARTPDGPSHLEEKLDRELQYHKHGSYNCHSEVPNGYQPSAATPHVQPSPFSIRQPEQDKPLTGSSVQSWTKDSTSQEETRYWPSAGYDSMTTPSLHPSHLSSSSPSLSACCFPSGSLFIQNASGIQIGNNNTLSIRGYDSSLSTLLSVCLFLRCAEDCPVMEEHLEVLRDNIGANWKRCARRLCLNEVEIETIELDNNRYGVPEMVHQMLEKWKMKEGRLGCTIGKLCRALEGKCHFFILVSLHHTLDYTRGVHYVEAF
uniref:Uncharacterized protein n=1 Tax=Periophthalmus magnuspinnatus TaxID=409849 RepID=A0A3B3ZR09_9GOBI